ncbi:MAG: hypothetical protein R3C16_13865 [Hyphomonadaceae bacterium]
MTATVDLPTPPLALATAMTCFTRPTPAADAGVLGLASCAVSTAMTLLTPGSARLRFCAIAQR